MVAQEIDRQAVTAALNEVVEFELAGVVRFTHYSLMVTGPHRIPIVAFLKQQANESLLHAQRAGEILTGYGGHPGMRIAKLEETHQHSLKDILAESHAHELRAVGMYRRLLEMVADRSVYLEEYARSMIAAEEGSLIEFGKMLRDFSLADAASPGAMLHPQPKQSRRRRAEEE